MRTLLLPFPPSVNNYRLPIRMGKSMRLITSPAGHKFEAAALACIEQQSPMLGRLQVSIMLHYGTRRQLDLDNFVKPLLDVCTAGKVWLDDSQIDKLIVHRGEVRKGGECFVVVETLGD